MTDQPHPTGVRLLPWNIPPLLVDVLFVAMAVAGFVRRPFAEDGAFEVVDSLALVLGIVVLLARRRYPVPALALAVASSVVVVAITERPTMLLPVTLVALYSVATQGSTRTTLIAGSVTTLIFATLIIGLLERGEIDGAGLASIAWPAFAAAAGAAVRSSRDNIRANQERATRAEQTRDLEAQRRVVEERLRIARDVHDLVAHHIAVVNVQAGVAEHLMASDPAAAGKALGVVREAASTVVDQLGELLGVLRSPDDAEDPTAPTPDLAAISDLISSFSASGLAITRESTGTPRPLSQSAELAAYRVVQEALTNAHKHGDGAADVAMRFSDAGLELIVTNAATTAEVEGGRSGGFGLVGMRERVEAVGGQLSAGPSPDGRRFEVAAHLPVRNEA